jgi:hypothetical protein
MRRSRLTPATIATAALLAIVGCASAEPASAPMPASASDGFLCGGVSISPDAVDARVPLSDLDSDARTALTEATWDDGLPLELVEDDWYLAAAAEDSVTVLRDVEVAPDPASPAIAPDHEVLIVSRMNDASNLPPGWYVSRSDDCARGAAADGRTGLSRQSRDPVHRHTLRPSR